MSPPTPAQSSGIGSRDPAQLRDALAEICRPSVKKCDAPPLKKAAHGPVQSSSPVCKAPSPAPAKVAPPQDSDPDVSDDDRAASEYAAQVDLIATPPSVADTGDGAQDPPFALTDAPPNPMSVLDIPDELLSAEFELNELFPDSPEMEFLNSEPLVVPVPDGVLPDPIETVSEPSAAQGSVPLPAAGSDSPKIRAESEILEELVLLDPEHLRQWEQCDPLWSGVSTVGDQFNGLVSTTPLEWSQGESSVTKDLIRKTRHDPESMPPCNFVLGELVSCTPGIQGDVVYQNLRVLRSLAYKTVITPSHPWPAFTLEELDEPNLVYEGKRTAFEAEVFYRAMYRFRYACFLRGIIHAENKARAEPMLKHLRSKHAFVPVLPGSVPPNFCYPEIGSGAKVAEIEGESLLLHNAKPRKIPGPSSRQYVPALRSRLRQNNTPMWFVERLLALRSPKRNRYPW